MNVVADGSTAHSGGGGMALAVQVTQLERRLRDERLAADVKAVQLEATIRRLEAQIVAEQQRRQSEQLRAIVEGAFGRPDVTSSTLGAASQGLAARRCQPTDTGLRTATYWLS